MIRDDDMLIWSDELRTFTLDDGGQIEESAATSEDYLFKVNTFNVFWTISQDMIQLNDYCVLCLQQTAIHLQVLNKDLADLKSGIGKVNTKYGDFSAEAMMCLEERIPLWNDNNSFLSRAMCLI